MVAAQETESGEPMDLLPSHHPLTPPLSEEDTLAWIRLLRSRRVGVTTFHRLLAEHGTAQAALDALPEVARAAGVQGYAPFPEQAAERELQAARKAGARFIAEGSAEYPARLAEIADAPPFLWAMGEPALMQRSTVALVGARNASSLGTRMAQHLAQGLGEAGHVVVSGLARGIDTAAHKAALPHGTIAVMAGGVDVIYPAENTALAADIARDGLRLAEGPVGLRPQARHFPQRNRIVSGLARAVVVVEAATRSGSLITARLAGEQGRDVLAVPGHPFDARASGCNKLLREGAVLVRNADDILELLDAQPGPAPRPKPAPEPFVDPNPPAQRPKEVIRALHQRILDRLGPAPLAEDQLIRDLHAPAASVAPELVTLELEGEIHRQPGGLLNRVK